VVDQYFAILENEGEKIETAEEKLIAQPIPENTSGYPAFETGDAILRKSVCPSGSYQLSATEGIPLISDPTIPYLKDVYDHTIQIIDTIENL